MPFLGQASIVIDQATLPPGVAGRSRNDGVTGQVVTLRNADNTNVATGGHRWVLLTPRTSTAVLSSPTSPTCTFTPDVDGTYLVELQVNEGVKSNQKAKALLAVLSPGGFRYPAQGEAAEANWTSAYTGNPNDTGWWEDISDILRSGQAAIDGTHVTVSTEAGLPNSRRLQVGSGISLVDGGPGGDLTIDTAIISGTKRLADVALQPENILSTRAVQASTRDNAHHGQTNLGAESVAGKGTQDDYASIGGGLDNLASGSGATVAGGSSNSATADSAAILGGTGNEASAFGAAIGGGDSNVASGSCAAVAGGNGNVASGQEAFSGSGTQNTASGARAAVVGGVNNAAGGARSVVCGGNSNTASGTESALAGGNTNTASGERAFVGAGVTCTASGLDSVVCGGSGNTASAEYGSIGGGYGNSVTGQYGSVPGGRDAVASSTDAHALGRGAQASHAGAVVLKDGNTGTQASSATHELTLRFDGGVRVLCSGGKITQRLGSSTSNYAELLQGQQSTTDASAQTVNFASIPSGQDCTVTVNLKGKQSSSANCKSLYYVATYTNNGGVVALTGAAHVSSTQATGLAAATVGVGISGTNLQLQFQGIAATTIRWTWDVRVHFGGAT